MNKKVISQGKDYTFMLPMLRTLVQKCRAKEDANLIWAGCPGTCYAMATFFSYGIRDLKLNLYFAVDADINNLWHLECNEEVGIIATRKAGSVKANIIILMSGLMKVPFENTLNLVRNSLEEGGKIIGESVVPNIYEREKWDEKISFSYHFEFTMENPRSYEVLD